MSTAPQSPQYLCSLPSPTRFTGQCVNVARLLVKCRLIVVGAHAHIHLCAPHRYIAQLLSSLCWRVLQRT
eukprot:4429336-Pleurochrysis_carterae.AAC.1